ncbi:MAG: molybdenum cofactor guanylyltransferase [Anaerolineales bacterium]|nr:molybdenum cofactor guanylyltransferase [Anaerolineales bacterium]MBS3752444.1 molybdenum cofactor guanylyltransferase [Anaerolineales bacterium]
MLSMIIQSGGKSTRMGEDKALRDFNGRPLIKHIHEKFSPLGDEVWVITNNPEDYQFLGAPLHTDVIPNRGALGGLYTALKISSHPHVGLVACDMPFASPTLTLHLEGVLQETGADAVLPSTEGGPEPLHAVYRRQTCLPLVKEALERDQWRMVSWHDQGDVRILSPTETGQITSNEYTFWNLNTPEEFRKAAAIAKNLKDPSDHVHRKNQG